MRPQIFVIIGVSGTGKSTVGEALAEALGWPFLEGDDLHPQENVDKMRAGTPLTDADRMPWLACIREWIASRLADHSCGVVACSALKRAYRNNLRDGLSEVSFILLDVDKALLTRRLEERSGHFMPAGLLDSQLADFERPAPDEPVLIVSADLSVKQQVETIIASFGLD